MKINKKLVVSINGFPQKIHLWGRNPDNPIILFVHGGPGNPFRHWIKKHFLPLTDTYTLAVYDQRGAGGSYRKMDPKDLHPWDYVKDIEGWAEWLCARYHQHQVYLVGESWGSFIGSVALLDKPELFKAYIGYGQVVDMKASLTIQYQETLEAVKARGLKDKEEKLLKIGAPVDGDFTVKNGLNLFYPIMLTVTKRDGTKVPFDLTKIESAIERAFVAEHTEVTKEITELLSLRVTADFNKKIKDDTIGVEDIQDSVEIVLIQAGYIEIARSYMLRV